MRASRRCPSAPDPSPSSAASSASSDGRLRPATAAESRRFAAPRETPRPPRGTAPPPLYRACAEPQPSLLPRGDGAEDEDARAFGRFRTGLAPSRSNTSSSPSVAMLPDVITVARF